MLAQFLHGGAVARGSNGRSSMKVWNQCVRRALFSISAAGVAALPLLCNAAPLGAAAIAGFCARQSEKFIHDPGGAATDALNAAPSEDCWPLIMRSEDSLDSLIAAVGHGSISAARYLAPHIGDLDGGDLEDSHVALGEFSMLHMTEFMGLVKEGAITEYDLKRSLVMLPLSLSDHIKSQLVELKKRRGVVERISDPALSHYREVALATLDSAIAERQRTISLR